MVGRKDSRGGAEALRKEQKKNWFVCFVFFLSAPPRLRGIYGFRFLSSRLRGRGSFPDRHAT